MPLRTACGAGFRCIPARAPRHRTPHKPRTPTSAAAAHPACRVNVGVTFAVYHGRSRSTCAPSWPSTAVPQDRQRPDEPRHRVRPLHAPLAPDPRVVQARGTACCRRTPVPHSISGSIPGSRTPPRPSGRSPPAPRPATGPAGRGPAPPSPARSCIPRYHSTSRTTWTRSSRVLLGERDRHHSARVGRRVLDHRLGVRAGAPPSCAARPSASAGAGRAARTAPPSSAAARSPGGSPAGPATPPR